MQESSSKRFRQRRADKAAADRRVILQSFSTAIGQELNNLSKWPWLCWQQLYNRLQWTDESVRSGLRSELVKRTAHGSSAWLHVLAPFRESSLITRTLEEKAGPVEDCQVSRDGTLIISASGRTIRIWNLETGEERESLMSQSLPVVRCALSPQDNLLATIAREEADGKNELTIWDLNTTLPATTLTYESDETPECVFNADGKLLIFSRDAALVVFDVTKHLERCIVRSLFGAVCSLAAHPDRKSVVSGNGDGSITMWNLESGRPKVTIEAHDSYVGACDASPSGEFVVAGSAQSLKVFDLKTRKLRSILKGHTGLVRDCAISSDNSRIISASADKTLRVWNAVTGAEEIILAGHSGEVTACNFTRDCGRVISASKDKSIKIWDIAAAKSRPSNFVEHLDSITACEFSSDGSLVLTASRDKTIKLWEQDSGVVRFTLENASDTCALAADHRFIASTSYPGIALRDLASGSVHITEPCHSDRITSCRISLDSSLIVSTSWDKTMVFWDSNTGQKIHSVRAHNGRVRACAISPDSSFVVTAGSDKVIRVWDLTTVTERTSFSLHRGEIMGLAVSPDASFVVSASWHELKTWSPVDARELCALTNRSEMIWDVAISPDAMLIVLVSDDRTLRIWSLASRQEVACLALPAPPSRVAFHPSVPKVICGDAAGGVYPVDLIGIAYGPLFVTPSVRGGVMRVRCPSCLNVFVIGQGSLGSLINCVNAKCGRSLQVNKFMVSDLY